MLGLIDGDVLLHSAMWNTKSIDEFIANCEFKLHDWTEAAWCDESVIALGAMDGKNYRDDVFPEYKQSKARSAGRVERPPHFKEAKEYISNLSQTVVADNEEADDLLGHWLTELGRDAVIISVDKDLKQVPGLHCNPQYVFNKAYTVKYFDVDEEEASRFFLQQMLEGDSMDNIPGVPGLGPKKSKAIIEEAESPALKVVEVYKKKFKDEWLNHFLFNGKLLFIQRKPNQYFTEDLYEEMFNVSLA